MNRIIISVFVFFLSSQITIANKFEKTIYPNYKSFSYSIQKKIDSAELRVWVSTHSLTDKEIFRALLNLSSKHGVDVRLLTNKRSIYPPKSRDFFAGPIPAKTRIFDPPSGVLIDNELFFADSEMQQKDKTARAVKVIKAPDSVMKVYESTFAATTKDSVVAKRSKNTVPKKRADNSSTYDYNRNSPRFTKPPQEVPHALPKVPLYQKKD